MKNKGITLVALIITIIVLLILATVSISLVINNGVLDKAQHGVDKYSEEEKLEQIKLAVASAMLKGNGFLETENLNAELQDRFQKGAEQIGNSKRWSLKLDKNYTIYENGNVEENESLLPAEYQQVEYIESSGTQYINCKYTTLNNYILLEGKLFFVALNGKRQLSGADGVCIGMEEDGMCSFGNTNILNEWHTLKLSVNKGTVKKYYKENILDDKVYKQVDSDYYPNDTIFCFTIGIGSNSVSSYNCKVKCSYYKIYNSGNLVRNFIPCYSTTTVTDVDGTERQAGTVGLYDTVEGKFYTNKGTGTFGYGMEDGTYVAPTNN